MKTRYKIIIVIMCAFLPISFVFPQIFLIFHLDKYETNEICDDVFERVNGNWDWFGNKCVIENPGLVYDNSMCREVGGIPTCDTRCDDQWQWNPWATILPIGCLDVCISACGFNVGDIQFIEDVDFEIKNISNMEWKQKIIDNELVATFKEMYPDHSSTNSQKWGFFSYTATNGYDTASLSLEISHDGDVITYYQCEIHDVSVPIILSNGITSEDLRSHKCFD